MAANVGTILQWDRPWALLLLPLCIVFILLLARRAKLPKAYTVVRTVSAALLVLAIAGTTLGLPGGKSGVFFLADVSASAAGDRQAVEQYLRGALGAKPRNVQAGVVAFGREAMVETPLSDAPAFTSLQTMPDTGFTDISQALTLGGALLPGAGRLVLISDGRQNLGSALEAADLLAARGITVDAALVPGKNAVSDAQVSEVKVPATLYEGEAFDVRVRVDATQSLSGTLRLMLGQQQLAEQAVTLTPGQNQFIFRLDAQVPGIQSLSAVLDVPGDTVVQNDRMYAATQVLGRPVVLLVEGEQGEARELDKMLAAQGVRTRVIGPRQLPETLEGLRPYQAVVLCNTSAEDVSPSAMLALQDAVRKLGRGLVMTGGQQSFALGGWKGTTIEDVLPVNMDVSGYMDAPDLALMMVIDRSGSMLAGEGGITRLDMAIQAAANAMQALRQGKDKVGVIAFDDTPYQILPLDVLTDLQAAQDTVGAIRPGGGTMMYAPLEQAMTQLEQTDARIKHIIVLTDGEPADSGFTALVEKMADKGITLSSVGVGQDANSRLLSDLATIGNGRYYACDAFTDIPKIFTQETYLATGAYLQIRSFTPAVAGANAVIQAFSGFPALDGYIGTSIKGTAQQYLVSDTDEPVYAAWQYGLGRAAAWTSDVTGAMSGNWLAWQEGARFFAGIIGDVLPAGQSGVYVQAQTEGDSGVAAVVWEDGLSSGRQAQAVVIAPDGSEQRVELSPVSPGRMEAGFEMPQEGTYIVQVQTGEDGQQTGLLETAVLRPWSPEYDLRLADAQALLTALVQKTGGRMLAMDTPAAAFAQQSQGTWQRIPLWPALALLALLVFMFDVAQRRLGLVRLYPALGAYLAQWISKLKPKKAVRGAAQPKAMATINTTVSDAASSGAKEEVQISAPAKQKPDKKQRKKADKIDPPDEGGLSSQLLSARKDQKKKWQ